MLDQVVINFHHVQHTSGQHDQRPFLNEFVILFLCGSGQPHLRSLGNIGPALDAEPSIMKREQKCKGTEVIALTEVGPQRTRHLPETLLWMRQCFLISEVIGCTLHRNAEPFRDDLVVLGGVQLRCLHILRIGLVADRDPQVRVCLDPHAGIVDFLDVVQLVPPDAPVRSNQAVRIVRITLENVLQFVTDRIPDPVPDSSLGTCQHDQVVAGFGSARFDSHYGILPHVGRPEFVDRVVLRPVSLELVDRTRPCLQDAPGHGVFNPLLGAEKLRP